MIHSPLYLGWTRRPARKVSSPRHHILRYENRSKGFLKSSIVVSGVTQGSVSSHDRLHKDGSHCADLRPWKVVRQSGVIACCILNGSDHCVHLILDDECGSVAEDDLGSTRNFMNTADVLGIEEYRFPIGCARDSCQSAHMVSACRLGSRCFIALIVPSARAGVQRGTLRSAKGWCFCYAERCRFSEAIQPGGLACASLRWKDRQTEQKT